MKIYDITRFPNMIELGFDGENNWRPNAFDCSSLLKNHPNGVLSLWLLPQGESQAFPVAVERDGNTIVWTPLSEEMTAEYGTLQIHCVDGSDVGKSDTVQYHVKDSIVPGADHPAAVPSWATQVMEQYQNAIEHYPTIIDSTWHVWDVDNETWEDTGVSAQGIDGADGHSPYIALNGHWMVYSDSAGEWIDTGVLASVDEAVIANAVAAYFDEHPIQVTETDPTVPAWAKQPDKPTYTAAEVGALPANTPIPPAVTVDSALSGTSENPVQNKVINAALQSKGTYSKPSGGIPKTDLASDVQTSLGKADTALQQHQSLAGYATESYVQQQIANIPDELPAVTASDNGKFLRVADGAWTAEAGDEYSAFPSDTASGAIASFPDGADDAPVKSLVAQIAPVQSGSGDPSPTNIRPISGWTSATVTRTGADNQSDTYTIAFPSEAGTVYGGTLDVTNGVLTVGSAIVDMGTLNWMYYSNQQRMVAQVNRAKPAAANVGLDGACSVYKVVNTGYRYMPDKSILIGNNFISNQYGAMVVHDEDYTDAATFKTAVSGQTLVFPIKNPVTYQLDPVTVTTLLGTNNIWADTGDVAVDYRADTGLYIQKLTGSTEEDMIVDAPIASGKYFLVGNTLYLSTAAIAAGATLTPGTNCVKTNLAEALNALNSYPPAESNSFGGGS